MQATGQYYYQSQDGETMTVVQGAEVEPQPPQPQVDDSGGGSNQVVMNTGGDQFQTVTIVPSESGGGGGAGGGAGNEVGKLSIRETLDIKCCIQYIYL